MLKINEFSDSLKNTTFYVEKINQDGELENIFIRDETNLFSDLIAAGTSTSNISIFAKTGYLQGKSLILFNGVVQSQNSKEVIEYLNFSKTELFLDNLTSRTIKQPKIQETSTTNLIRCLYDKQFIKNCPPDKIKKEVLQNLSRRIGMPFYIPVGCLICCFMLFSSSKNDKWYRKYSIFIQGFTILVLAEILVRYSGFSKLNTIIYFVTPFVLILFLYSLLLLKINYEKSK
jgi:lipopolysaccharide export LptBFGC system permease protein LptF